jgi:hypothetical protein
MARGSAAWHPWISLAVTNPRHAAPPRYVSEKLVRDSIDSALMGTFDGRSLRLPPSSSSPGTERSVSNSSICAALAERTPVRAITLLFESETGPDENRPSQAALSESSNARNSRSDRSSLSMIDVDYAMSAVIAARITCRMPLPVYGKPTRVCHKVSVPPFLNITLRLVCVEVLKINLPRAEGPWWQWALAPIPCAFVSLSVRSRARTKLP